MKPSGFGRWQPISVRFQHALQGITSVDPTKSEAMYWVALAMPEKPVDTSMYQPTSTYCSSLAYLLFARFWGHFKSIQKHFPLLCIRPCAMVVRNTSDLIIVGGRDTWSFLLMCIDPRSCLSSKMEMMEADHSVPLYTFFADFVCQF